MSPQSGSIVWCVLFAAIAAAGTWAARAYALHRQLIDQPGARRSHRVPTPRGGGIAIVAALLIAITAMILRRPDVIVLLVCAGFGLMLVSGIGWIDDHRPLSAWSRLVVHAVAAGWLATGFYLSGSSGVLAVLTGLLALVLTNIWNFMDGIDGLAASQAGLVAAAVAMASGDPLTIHLALALAAAVSGFLPFNFPRARIFLGDVGSGALGFALALLTGLWLREVRFDAWWLAVLPLSAFLIDAGYTLFTRMLRGERWWTPHVSHAYQRWARHAGRHLPVTFGYAVWTLVASAGMIWFLAEGRKGGWMALMMWLALGSGLWYWLRSRPEPSFVTEETNA